MGRKDGESSAGGLVLVRSSQCPEGDGPAAKLSEPALQFRLSGIVGQTAQVKHLAPFGQESPNIGVCIHGPSENLGVLMGRLRLADQAAQHTGQRDRLLHGTAWRGGGQCLQMEWEVVLDGGGGLDGLDLEGSADVGEGAGSKGQGLGVVGLPALVFGAQVEGARVLQVCGQHHSLVSGLAGQLHTQIPRIQGHKGKLEVLVGQVFLGEGIESGDGIAEGTCGADVFPGQGGQARCIVKSAHRFPNISSVVGCEERPWENSELIRGIRDRIK